MTALVNELAYVVVQTSNVNDWAHFAQSVPSFEVSNEDGNAYFRLDSRPFRYLVQKGNENRLPVLGWKAAGSAQLELVARLLKDMTIEVVSLTSAELATRRVDEGIRFICGNGIEHEVVYGGLGRSAPIDLSGDVTGFVTDKGGMGHVVWRVPDIKEMDRILMDVFAMALREDISTPTVTGHFYGCNQRHHSVAAFSGPELKFEHFMVEMNELDDVGRALDRAAEQGYEILQPLGRHRTDHMVSFYVATPSGYEMEIGFGGVLCGDDWEAVREGCRRRHWGHGKAVRNHQMGVLQKVEQTKASIQNK